MFNERVARSQMNNLNESMSNVVDSGFTSEEDLDMALYYAEKVIIAMTNGNFHETNQRVASGVSDAEGYLDEAKESSANQDAIEFLELLADEMYSVAEESGVPEIQRAFEK